MGECQKPLSADDLKLGYLTEPVSEVKDFAQLPAIPSEAEAKFQNCMLYEVVLDKIAATDKIGLTFVKCCGTESSSGFPEHILRALRRQLGKPQFSGLKIIGIKPSSEVARHNWQMASFGTQSMLFYTQICLNDIVVAVNGLTEVEAMSTEMKTSRELLIYLQIYRPGSLSGAVPALSDRPG